MIFINVTAGLLGALCDWSSLIDHHLNLKYFCVECGSELSINEQKSPTSTKSQQCLSCGYTLLYGGIKKHSIAKRASVSDGMH